MHRRIAEVKGEGTKTTPSMFPRDGFLTSTPIKHQLTRNKREATVAARASPISKKQIATTSKNSRVIRSLPSTAHSKPDQSPKTQKFTKPSHLTRTLRTATSAALNSPSRTLLPDSSSPFQKKHALDDEESDPEDDENSSNESESSYEFSDWGDGRTLIEAVAGFVEDSSDSDNDIETKLELVNGLSDHLSAQSSRLKKGFVDVLEPCLKNEKYVLSYIASDIEGKKYKQSGVVAYSDGAEAFGGKVTEISTNLREETEAVQTRIKDLFKQLSVEEAKRTEWWTHTGELLGGFAGQVQQEFETLDSSLEKTIGLSQKKLKTFGDEKGVRKKKGNDMDALKSIVFAAM